MITDRGTRRTRSDELPQTGHVGEWGCRGPGGASCRRAAYLMAPSDMYRPWLKQVKNTTFKATLH